MTLKHVILIYFCFLDQFHKFASENSCILFDQFGTFDIIVPALLMKVSHCDTTFSVSSSRHRKGKVFKPTHFPPARYIALNDHITARFFPLLTYKTATPS